MELRELHKNYKFNSVNPLNLNNFYLNGESISIVKQNDKSNFVIKSGLFK